MGTRILDFKAVLFLLFAFIAAVAQGKSVYFSYNSGANIIFVIYDDGKKGEVTINGRKMTGIIEEKCDMEENLSCFSSKEKELLFLFEGSGDNGEYGESINVLNQHYSMPGASEKVIYLYLINQPNNMKLLYPNDDESNYIIDNVQLMNDKAYYLEQLGAYAEAIYILKKVISKSPDRVVAYLNIADAYWGNNEKGEAKKSYEKYVELMKSQGKNVKKIPQRVYDRIKSEPEKTAAGTAAVAGKNLDKRLINSDGEAWTMMAWGTSFTFFGGFIFQSNDSFIELEREDVCKDKDCSERRYNADWNVTGTGTWHTDGNKIIMAYKNGETVTMPYTVDQKALRFDTDTYEYQQEYSKGIINWNFERGWKDAECKRYLRYANDFIIQECTFPNADLRHVYNIVKKIDTNMKSELPEKNIEYHSTEKENERVSVKYRYKSKKHLRIEWPKEKNIEIIEKKGYTQLKIIGFYEY